VLPQQQLSRKNPDDDREVFRSAGSIVLSWAWLIVAVIALIDLAVQGRDHPAVVTALLIIAISAVVYGCAWRPRIVADSSGITVANPLRDHQVPWAAVSNVDVVNAVRVHCTPAPGETSGKIIYSWAVQASPSSARRAARRAGLSGQRPRLTRPRSSRMDPPPGATPGYGQIPEPARDALDRTSAEFTAGRLAERAQHARQALVVKAQAEAGQQAPPEPASAESAGAAPASAQPLGAGPLGAGPLGAGPLGAGPAGAVAGAGEQPVTRWAWGPIVAMVVPIAILIIVALT
jgi:Bacterial PH domain